MGGSSSKQDIVAKLEELDKKELDLNLKLKDMQVELNGMVPKEEQIKVNQQLTPNVTLNHNYTAGPPPGGKSTGKSTAKSPGKKKKGKKGKGKSTKSKGEKKTKK